MRVEGVYAPFFRDFLLGKLSNIRVLFALAEGGLGPYSEQAFGQRNFEVQVQLSPLFDNQILNNRFLVRMFPEAFRYLSSSTFFIQPNR